MQAIRLNRETLYTGLVVHRLTVLHTLRLRSSCEDPGDPINVELRGSVLADCKTAKTANTAVGKMFEPPGSPVAERFAAMG